MIHQYQIRTDENEDFLLTIEADAQTTFQEFGDTLSALLGYDPATVSLFYLCDERWERRVQVAPAGLFDADDMEQYDMAAATLEEPAEEPGEQLQYLFDPLSDRALYIRLTSIHSGSLPKPRVIELTGMPPRQTSADDMLLETEDLSSAYPPSIEDGESMYGDRLYDAEELPADGFDITEGY